MAQEPLTPWSRWDPPGVRYQPTFQNGAFRADAFWAHPSILDTRVGVVTPQRDSVAPQLPFIRGGAAVGGELPGQAVVQRMEPASFLPMTLVAKQRSALDPSFYDCVYSLPNTAHRIIEQCHTESGCCENGCCEQWRFKYGWALALVCLFCATVLIASLVWLVLWAANRRRDKWQREQLITAEKGSGSHNNSASAAEEQPKYTLGTSPPFIQPVTAIPRITITTPSSTSTQNAATGGTRIIGGDVNSHY